MGLMARKRRDDGLPKGVTYRITASGLTRKEAAKRRTGAQMIKNVKGYKGWQILSPFRRRK